MRPRLLSLLFCIAPFPMLIAPGACGHNGSPPSPAGCSRAAASSIDAGLASASAIASSQLVAPDAGLPHAIDRGCAQDISTALTPSAQLEAAGRTCAPSMATVLAPKGYAATPSQSASAHVELARHACVRIGMASEPSGIAVQAHLIGPDGSAAGAWRGVTPLMIAESGPVCVREAGSYAVHAQPNASTTIWIAAWGAQPPPP